MVDFRYNNNAIRNQKHFKTIANGDVADSGMTGFCHYQQLTSHFYVENLKKNGSLNVNLD